MRPLTSPINRPVWAPLRGWDFTITICLAFSVVSLFSFEFLLPFPLEFDSFQQLISNTRLPRDTSAGIRGWPMHYPDVHPLGGMVGYRPTQ
jgi:hypothetical protein